MGYGQAEYGERPRRRTGRRIMITFLVLLLILFGLLVVADRVGASVAEDKLAQRVSQELANRDVTSSSLDVTFGGFPFVTQVIRGQYQSISLTVKDMANQSVRVPRFDAEARDVTAPLKALTSGQGDIQAKTVRGTATVEYDSVAKLMKQPDLKLAERNGKLVATVPVNLLGQKFTLTGEADVSIVKGKVRLKFTDLTANGIPNAPGVRGLVNGIAKQLSIDFALPVLPFALEVQDVKPLADGLQVTATAKDVPLNKRV